MPPEVALIIPAAGEGTRMKSSTRKPFMLLTGEPILYVTLERFLGIPGIVQVILALNPVEFARRDEIFPEVAPLGVSDIVEGGATRTETVSAALGRLAENIDIVLIHDAVRPFVAREVIEGVIEAAARSGAAIAAAPVKDTLKRVEKGLSRATLPRAGLYCAQTPQGFERNLIEKAYRNRRQGAFTDDASLVEDSGGAVVIVESRQVNFKITTPADLELANAVLSASREGRLDF